MRGDYVLKLPDGKSIPMRFCIWSLQRCCELNLVSFYDMTNSFITELRLDMLINLIHAAVEYKYVKAGEDCPYEEMDVAEWIDDLGGIGAPEVVEMVKLVIESISSKKNVPAISEDQKAAEIKTILEQTEAKTKTA